MSLHRTVLAAGRLAAVLLLAGLGASPARAAERGRSYLLENGSFELVLAAGGWRSSISSDGANPGFSVLGGGGELVVGIDIVPGVGIIASGRVLAAPHLSGVYLEGLGGLGVQVRLSEWVRLRLGIASGLLRLAREGLATDSTILLGGFVAASVDLFHLGRGRAAVETMLRLDVDGHLVTEGIFPAESLALSVGLGFRF